MPFATPHDPLVFLKKETLKGGLEAWKPYPTPHPGKDGRDNLLYQGSSLPAIVISHDCALDKDLEDRSGGRVLLAPLLPESAFTPAVWSVILDQELLALMPVPDIPLFGTLAADLRCMTSVRRPLVDQGKRLASMAEHGIERTQAQVYRFLFRREMPSVGLTA